MQIFIADDYKETVDLLSNIVTLWNPSCQVRVAHDGEQVFDLINKHGYPDLLILDYIMPKMTGDKVIEKIRSNGYERFPILVITAYTEKNTIHRLLKLGADDACIKPFLINNIQMKIEKLITQYQEKKQILNIFDNIQYEGIVTMCRLVEAKDGLTGEHINRVGEYSALIAKKIGFDDEKCMWIRYAAKIHDIGKVKIPDSILQKPDRLTPDEFNVIKEHTTAGFEILKDCQHNNLLQYAKDIVLYHHEWWNGNGYPYGLKGENIPLSARIVTVTDVFDALTHKRVYKDAWSKEQALQYIQKQKGKQFDPEVVETFVDVVK